MTAGDLAQWVGAIGTVAAVWLTAVVYLLDRRREHKREAAAQADLAARRSFSAWQQSILLIAPLKAAAERANALEIELDAAVAAGTVTPHMEIPEITQIQPLLSDPSAFEEERLNLILMAIASGGITNTALSRFSGRAALTVDEINSLRSILKGAFNSSERALIAVRQVVAARSPKPK